jgi:hypothetical protein
MRRTPRAAACATVMNGALISRFTGLPVTKRRADRSRNGSEHSAASGACASTLHRAHGYAATRRDRRRHRAGPSSGDHVVEQLHDAVRVALRLTQPQHLLVAVGVAEQALAGTEQHWKDQQVVAVYQARVRESAS